MSKNDLLPLLAAMEKNAWDLYLEEKKSKKTALKNRLLGEYRAFNTIRCALLDADFCERMKEIYLPNDDGEAADESGEIQVFYTGGGIWISAVCVDESHYCTVDNDNEEVLTMYDKTEEDGEFACQSVVWSKPREDLSAKETKIHKALVDQLHKEMF